MSDTPASPVATSGAAFVPVTLRAPAPPLVWSADALKLSGLEIMRALRARQLPPPPISLLTGAQITDVGLGKTTFAMPASPWWQSGAGVFLAGALAFLADAPLGGAVFTSAPPATTLATSELAINFLRPAGIRSLILIARGNLIHETRSTGLSDATIEDGRGQLLAHATCRCILSPIPASVLEALSSQSAPPQAEGTSALPYTTPAEGDVYSQEVWDSTPGREVMRRWVEEGFMPPVFRFFGMRGVSVGDGEMTVAMPASGWLVNAFGAVYGGCLAMLADAAITAATASIIPPATAFSPLDLKVNFLRPVFPTDGELTATARLVHRGRTITVATCEIKNAGGKPVAIANGSVLILPGRPWDRPVYVQDELASASG